MWVWGRRLVTVLGFTGRAEALGHVRAGQRAAPVFSIPQGPVFPSVRAVALAPIHSRWRGGASGLRRASTRAAGSGTVMLSGAATSAAIIGGLNALGLAVTLAAPSEGEKVTDLLGTGAIALSAIVVHLRSPIPLSLRAALVTTAVVSWGVRLASFLFYRVQKTGSDTRLTQYFATPKSMLSFWATSALWGWLTALPQSLLCFSPAAAAVPLGPVGALAAGVLFTAIVAEAVADWQKWTFKSNPNNKERWCDQGLWALCRHPNYASELTVWSSLYVLALPGLVQPHGSLLARFGGAAAAALGPAFVALIILRVSGVPIAEARSDRKFGHVKAYQEYKRDTPLLIPRLNSKVQPPSDAQ